MTFNLQQVLIVLCENEILRHTCLNHSCNVPNLSIPKWNRQFYRQMGTFSLLVKPLRNNNMLCLLHYEFILTIMSVALNCVFLQACQIM